MRFVKVKSADDNLFDVATSIVAQHYQSRKEVIQFVLDDTKDIRLRYKTLSSSFGAQLSCDTIKEIQHTPLEKSFTKLLRFINIAMLKKEGTSIEPAFIVETNAAVEWLSNNKQLFSIESDLMNAYLTKVHITVKRRVISGTNPIDSRLVNTSISFEIVGKTFAAREAEDCNGIINGFTEGREGNFTFLVHRS